MNRIRPPLPLDLRKFAACNLTFPADSVVSHSECPAPTDLHEPAAQDQPFGCGDEAPDPREDGAHLQRPPHWRQAAGSEVRRYFWCCGCLHLSANLLLLALVIQFAAACIPVWCCCCLHSPAAWLLPALVFSAALLICCVAAACTCLQFAATCTHLWYCCYLLALLLIALVCSSATACTCLQCCCYLQSSAVLLLLAVICSVAATCSRLQFCCYLHSSAVLHLPCAYLQFCYCVKTGQCLNVPRC